MNDGEVKGGEVGGERVGNRSSIIGWTREINYGGSLEERDKELAWSSLEG